MDLLKNRGIYIVLGICLCLLIFVVIILVMLNRPTTTQNSFSPSPTPIPGQETKTSPSTQDIPQGESEFSEQDMKQFVQNRARSDQAYQERKRRMPFITQLPYTTNHFKIEITAVSDTLYITIYGAPSYQTLYREEALTWLRQNGGNTQTLTIMYR